MWNNVCTLLQWRTVSAITIGLFWCLFPKLGCNEGNKHQNNTLVSAWTVCHEYTHYLIFTQHNKSVNDDKIDDLHTSSPCLSRSVYILLMTSQSIADDIKITKHFWHEQVKSGIQLVRYRFYSRRYSWLVMWESTNDSDIVQEKWSWSLQIMLCNLPVPSHKTWTSLDLLSIWSKRMHLIVYYCRHLILILIIKMFENFVF